MVIKQQLRQLRLLSFSTGIAGGLIMIAASYLTTNGPLQITPLPLVLLFTLVWVTRLQLNTSFRQLFTAGCITAGIMLLVYLAYVRLIMEPDAGLAAMDYLILLGIQTVATVVSSLMAAGLVQLLRQDMSKAKLWPLFRAGNGFTWSCVYPESAYFALKVIILFAACPYCH